MSSRAGLRLLAIAVAMLWSRSSSATPTDWPIIAAFPSSQLAGSQWSCANVYDGNVDTAWSSKPHSTAENLEWLYVWISGPRPVNYVKVAGRFDGASARGFPVEFGFQWWDGSTWHQGRSYTHFTRPGQQWVTFTLATTAMTSELSFSAQVLGEDQVGTYAFQIAEVKVGYDPDLEGLEYTPTPNTGVDASTQTWPTTNAADGNAGTAWSSAPHSTPGNTEWLAYRWPQGFEQINFVKLLPRYSKNTAIGFPTSFAVYYSDGARWIQIASYSSFPNPYRGDWIVLPLPSTVVANGIQLIANQLGSDGIGNYVFQVAEVRAGYNALFNSWMPVTNDGVASRNEIRGIGSEPIDRLTQLGNWNQDERSPLIAPNAGVYRNIYAPSVVKTGATSWNVYFGGWDGAGAKGDNIYQTSSDDDFGTIGVHQMEIASVPRHLEANNDCVLNTGPNDWRMVYTTWPGRKGSLNRPAAAFSIDGVNWTPNLASSRDLISVAGYPDWATADVNGGNVVYRDASGLWHLYFDNLAPGKFTGVYHATSADFWNYTYLGEMITNPVVIMNDFKSFTSGGKTYYVGAYHVNGQSVWTTMGESTSLLPPLTIAFTNDGSIAQPSFVVSVGLVQDGSRLYGMLYGAGPKQTLDQNQIYARWLQKKVTFQNANVQWGFGETASGPDKIHLWMPPGEQIETGRFSVYDTDGTTLLYESPTVTMRAGDVWSYVPGD